MNWKTKGVAQDGTIYQETWVNLFTQCLDDKDREQLVTQVKDGRVKVKSMHLDGGKRAFLIVTTPQRPSMMYPVHLKKDQIPYLLDLSIPDKIDPIFSRPFRRNIFAV